MPTIEAVIGIDPGMSGGIAIIFPDTGEIEYWKMPTTDQDLSDTLGSLPEECKYTAFVENVHSSPQMGVVSAFKFGRCVGAIHMACTCAGIRMQLVSPQRWQKYHGLLVHGKGLGQRDTDKKNRNKAKAQQLFPQLKITHAIADSLLIAEYGRAVLAGQVKV